MEREYKITSRYALQRGIKPKYKRHLKRLYNYKRILLDQKKPNKGYYIDQSLIDQELHTTSILIMLVAFIIDQKDAVALPITQLLPRTVNISYAKFQKVLVGKISKFKSHEIDNVLSFLKQ
jgi:hypothetical protein